MSNTPENDLESVFNRMIEEADEGTRELIALTQRLRDESFDERVAKNFIKNGAVLTALGTVADVVLPIIHQDIFEIDSAPMTATGLLFLAVFGLRKFFPARKKADTTRVTIFKRFPEERELALFLSESSPEALNMYRQILESDNPSTS